MFFFHEFVWPFEIKYYIKINVALCGSRASELLTYIVFFCKGSMVGEFCRVNGSMGLPAKAFWHSPLTRRSMARRRHSVTDGIASTLI